MHALGDILDQSNKRQLSSGHGVNQLARRNIDIKTCQRSSSHGVLRNLYVVDTTNLPDQRDRNFSRAVEKKFFQRIDLNSIL